jgi:hypothetical protein
MDSQQCSNRLEQLTFRVPGWQGSGDELGMKQQTLVMAADQYAQYKQYQYLSPTRHAMSQAAIAQIGPWLPLNCLQHSLMGQAAMLMKQGGMGIRSKSRMRAKHRFGQYLPGVQAFSIQR